MNLLTISVNNHCNTYLREGCQRAATMYATGGAAARRLGSAARARTSLAPGRFQRWMLDVRVAPFVHEYAAIYLCAGMETLLEEIALIAGSNAGSGPITPAAIDHAVATCADLWGLLQPYSHLNAGRVASAIQSSQRRQGRICLVQTVLDGDATRGDFAVTLFADMWGLLQPYSCGGDICMPHRYTTDVGNHYSPSSRDGVTCTAINNSMEAYIAQMKFGG
ncbi:hypothetical protein evm_015380 [Chilo suppressalis]|nr:hypothetical protein evm_015380 [Chilo suppressalis]